MSGISVSYLRASVPEGNTILTQIYYYFDIDQINAAHISQLLSDRLFESCTLYNHEVIFVIAICKHDS